MQTVSPEMANLNSLPFYVSQNIWLAETDGVSQRDCVTEKALGSLYDITCIMQKEKIMVGIYRI